MGTLWPENLCAHRKGEIDELIKGRARDLAAQQQIRFGNPTGDLLVKLLTSFALSLSHLLMKSCEDCEVGQLPNEVGSPIGDHRSVDPGDSSRRPAAEDRRGGCKRRRTDKHDQGCQAAKQVQRIQEAPHMYPTNYFDHHTCRSYPLNNPSQNPLLEVYLLSFASEPYALSITSETISTQHSETYPFSLKSETISTQHSETYPFSLKSETISTQDSEPYRFSFSSETISTQDSEPYPFSFSSETISTQYSEPYRLSFSSETISTQYSEPCRLSFSSETISTQYTSSCPSSECGEETNTLSGDLLLQSSQRPQPDLLLQPSQRPQPMIVTFSQGMESHLKVNYGEVKAEEALQRSRQFTAHLPKRSEAVAIQRSNKRMVVVKVSMNRQKSLFFWRFGNLNVHKSRYKALKVVIGVSGVQSASIKGQDMDQIEVTGEDIDAVTIAKLLRKNLGFAELVAVGPVEEKKPEKPKEKEKELELAYAYGRPPPYYVQEINEPASCSIM